MLKKPSEAEVPKSEERKRHKTFGGGRESTNTAKNRNPAAFYADTEDENQRQRRVCKPRCFEVFKSFRFSIDKSVSTTV
ncbi:MAG TPA: hypothetical protein DCE08_06955 [Ruminococcaceae bacterium]|nr:hypothetical protein [Oscillospiraceae bacterium]